MEGEGGQQLRCGRRGQLQRGPLLALVHLGESSLGTLRRRSISQISPPKSTSSIELLKRCLLFMGMSSENKYAYTKRGTQNVRFSLIILLPWLNTDTASLSVYRIFSRMTVTFSV